MQLKLVALTLSIFWPWWSFEGAVGDPQLFFLTFECSTVSARDLSNLYQNRNASFAALRSQVSNQSKHFAAAQSTSGSDPVYATFQCRNYLSNTDCTTCFDAAAANIRNCSTGNTAHLVYDGCILRYLNSVFLDNSIIFSSHTFCGNQTADESTAFGTVGRQVLMDLQIAIPKISGYFAATKTQVAGGAMYAFAQCAETLTRDTCSNCLSNQLSNIQGCLPNTNGRAIDPAGCFMRYSETPYFADNQTTDISLFLKQGPGGSMSKWVTIGGGLAGALLVVILLSLFPWYRRSQSPKRVPRAAYTLGATELKAATKYKYSDLKAATKNFSEKNKLGEGGFGAVYKGTMKNGKVVAVKKLLSGKSSKIDDEFDSEVTLISNVHHKNLVRLLGCCSKGQDRILVYEYMANNSLDKFLFGKKKGSLNWRQRYDIILGTARGLAYLHEEFHVSVIHRDIKSGNILLDEELQPKIADFGLAKLLPSDQSHLSTRFAGTLGYTAPEYALHGQLSKKADTYSYGIVVLEIISGRKSTDVNVVNDDNEDDYLLRQAWKLYESGKHLELVDKSLNLNNYDSEEVKKVIGIALLCTQASSAMRPAMSEVVVQLNSNDLLEHMRPSMPIFFESNLRAP
ncbi:Cysteine-rich receptor-like protein kinase 2 [Glycine soja]|uniref:Cysteine-rich receptor-like protein kinase 2 n=1 Tax=Glycine soja TaxID=3848 RepID=A0A445I552_GLYSO|nr:Cysteine-rich receptor-like protein kinase 2 [Glycine soja]